MLVNALEASGIEGNFRLTCERVMQVLRDNKESLMAVLEAFVYDPLFNMRLLNTAAAPKGMEKGARASTAAGSADSGTDRHFIILYVLFCYCDNCIHGMRR